jgi:hypothetical protein
MRYLLASSAANPANPSGLPGKNYYQIIQMLGENLFQKGSH